MKDFKDSWEQKAWEFALASYVRSKNALVTAERLKSEKHVDYLKARIKELETRYPQLTRA